MAKVVKGHDEVPGSICDVGETQVPTTALLPKGTNDLYQVPIKMLGAAFAVYLLVFFN